MVFVLQKFIIICYFTYKNETATVLCLGQLKVFFTLIGIKGLSLHKLVYLGHCMVCVAGVYIYLFTYGVFIFVIVAFVYLYVCHNLCMFV